jgi:hypothetical protein
MKSNIYTDNNIIITHYFINNNYITNYKLAEKFNYCKILEIANNYIVIQMPIYNMLINYYNIKKNIFITQMYKLIDELIKYNIIHYDLSPKNIGVDKYGNFRLINLYKINFNNSIRTFLHYFQLQYINYYYYGFEKEHYDICNYIKQKNSKL